MVIVGEGMGFRGYWILDIGYWLLDNDYWMVICIIRMEKVEWKMKSGSA
jgi:hypothetical protein